MQANGRIITKKAGECTFGLSPKVKANMYATDTKAIGSMGLEMDMESFIMQTVPGTKAIGKTT